MSGQAVPRSIALLLVAIMTGACGGTAVPTPGASAGVGGTTLNGPSGSAVTGPVASGTGSGVSPSERPASGAPGSGAPGPGAPASAALASGGVAAVSGSPPAAGPSTSNGTGGSSGAPGAAGLPGTIGIPGLGLSLRLPSGWVGLDSTIPPSIVEATAIRFPDLAGSLAMLGTAELGFVGYDATSTGATTPHLTIATTGDAIAVVSLLDALAKQTADQLARTESISEVGHAAATLAAGPAAELRYLLKPRGGGPEVAVDAWFISTAGHTFLLKFTVPAATAGDWLPRLRAVAESLSGA